MSAPVKIVALLTAHAGKVDELKALLDTMLEKSRSEQGNLRYDVWRDRADANRYVLDELYVDDAAVSAHRETPHFKDYLSKIGSLAERIAIVLDPISTT